MIVVFGGVVAVCRGEQKMIDRTRLASEDTGKVESRVRVDGKSLMSSVESQKGR